MKEISENDKVLFKKLRSELDINPVYIHTSYLINMASFSDALFKKSVALLTEEMNRADAIGADFVILHTGSASYEDKKTARKRAINGLRKVFANKKWNAGLLLENTAGEKGDIASEMPELAEIMDSLNNRIAGICIDTCHAFAAGYDLKKDKGVNRLLQEIKKYIGLGKLRLIHLNDSKFGVGLHRDRHEHIGKGRIGTIGLRKVIAAAGFSHIPLILETPKKAETDDINNLRKARRMLQKKLNSLL